MAQTTSQNHRRGPLWPVGTEFVNRQDLTDVDAEERPRVTPAGSLWKVVERDQKKAIWHLVCNETGAWVGASKNRLLDEFDPCPHES
jgi:hypothetical protein